MHLSRRLIRWFAWTLIIAFVAVVVGKYQHSRSCNHGTEHCCAHQHDTEKVAYHSLAQTCVDDGAQATDEVPVVKSQCSICDFHFFYAQTPTLFHYNPYLAPLKTTLVERALKLVYHPLLSINAHSPPFFFEA